MGDTALTNIMLEVEGVLEDVIGEVFRNRICPMLERAPGQAVRLVVTTEPLRYRAGREVGENFFDAGAPGGRPEFSWQSAGVFRDVIQRFRYGFLENLDSRALESHVLLGIYGVEPCAAEGGAGQENMTPVHDAAWAAGAAADPGSAVVSMEEVREGSPGASGESGADDGQPHGPGRVAQVIEAVTPLPLVIEDVPEDVYLALPEAEIELIMPGLVVEPEEE